MIEIPPKFAGGAPVNPEGRRNLAHSGSWTGATGLAEDVRYYGKWMRDEAERHIGHLYPKVKVTAEMAQGRDDLKGVVGKELTVIAWLWARTVKCPNPACGAEMPLVRSFALSTKKGREAWVEPIVDRRAKTISFRAHRNKTNAPSGTKLKGKSRCLICGIDNVTDSILREQASTYSISQQLLAIVAKGSNGRVYLEPPQTDSGTLIKALETPWLAQNLPDNARWFSPPGYGLRTYRDLFTPRQLVTLTTFSDLVATSRERVLEDARKAGMADDGKGIDEGGIGVPAYADAVATYLAFAVDKGADYWSTICSWHSSRELVRNTFARQAIPMVWDFAEANPLSDSAGCFSGAVDWVVSCISRSPASEPGWVKQLDATAAANRVEAPIVATDPPTTTSVTPTSPTSSTYGSVARSEGSTRNSSARCWFPKLRSSSPLPIVSMAVRKRRSDSLSKG